MKVIRAVLMTIAVGATALFLVKVASASNYDLATWYGPGLYGNSTACGWRLGYYTRGVAHKTLPCGTHITVCLKKCVRAMVIDRGPYSAATLDLTRAIKYGIGMNGGTAYVRWWVH